jgi:outer membrane protein assembly factor BamB/DNA-binding beta-propeller fold protein YncE
MSARPTFLPALAIAVVIGTTACNGSATTSPTGPADSAAPPASLAPAIASPISRSAPPLAVTDWNGFRGDASRTGIGANGPLGHPVLNWQYHAKSAVPNNLSVIGDQVSFASDDGTVYALDRATGAERWVVNIGNAPLIGPFAADGRLYFLNGAGAAIALDAATGKSLWTSPKTYDGPSQLAGADGALYFGTGDGRVVGLEAATGTERWAIKPTETTTHVDNPAVADGRVFAGTDGGGFVAIDVATHQLAWSGDTNGEDTGTATVNGDLAFIATGGDAQTGQVRAFDTASGKLRWASADQRLTFPVVADGLAISSTMQGLVDAMDLQTGAMRWSIQLTGKIRPMAVANHVLYIPADTEKKVYAVDVATGGILWHFDVDESNDCCIAVTGGAVYVATMNGTVYSIGGDGASVAVQPPASSAPSARPNPTPTPTPAPLADLPVKQAWSTDLRKMGFSPECQIAVDPTTGRIWMPEAIGDKLAILDPKGAIVEEWGGAGGAEGAFDFTRQNGDGYGTLAFAKDGSFYVLDVGNRRILHYNAHRKLVGQWGEFGTGPGQYSDPVGIGVAPDGSVWVLDDRRSVVEHYTAGGKVLGSFDPFATTPSNDGANILYVDGKGRLFMSGADPAAVYRFDAHGTFVDLVGQGSFREQAGTIAVDADGRVFVTQGPERGTAPGVLVFGSDGTLLGGFAPEGVGDGQVVFPGGVALDGKGGLYLFDSLPDTARLMKFTLPANLR